MLLSWVLSTFSLRQKFFKEKCFGKLIFKSSENWFKFFNDSEDKTSFWRVQLLPLIWNRDYEDDTLCFSDLSDFLVQSFGLRVNNKFSKASGEGTWCFWHVTALFSPWLPVCFYSLPEICRNSDKARWFSWGAFCYMEKLAFGTTWQKCLISLRDWLLRTKISKVRR